jgi:uncharacterized protein YdaU (DUF1376 family)
MKIRRFDLYPDDAIAGMIELTNEERGVLAMAIFAIYSHGGPITRDHLRRLCPGHARTHQRIESRLLELNKLCVTDDGKLSQKRCKKRSKTLVTDSKLRRKMVVEAGALLAETTT